MLLWMVSLAHAGDGPWALDAGIINAYVGTDYFRYSRFQAAKADDTASFQAGITGFAVNAILGMGLREGIEGEFKIGVEGARTNNPGTGPCASPVAPTDFCDPTVGVGDFYGRLKVRILDEYKKPPLTASVSVMVRSGEAYARTRHRLTNLGSGQTDVGALLHLGRKGHIGLQDIRFHVAGGYFYRFSNRHYAERDFEMPDPDDPNAFVTVHDPGGKAPGDEIWAEAEFAFTLPGGLEIGPYATLFHQLEGIDIGPVLDFSDPNVWNRLRGSQAKVGGRASIFALQNITFSATVLGTVWARNNPSDTFAFGFGIGRLTRPKEK